MSGVTGDHKKIIIIGAGLSGILTAIKLHLQGMTDFLLLEMADAPGGVWRDNTYPGLTCDVPAQAYSYSFDPSWQWESLYGTRDEIYDYIRHCIEKYSITSHIQYGKRVEHLLQVGKGWEITTENEMKYSTDIVILCCGSLVYPKLPEIAGIDKFDGSFFHSVHWDHNLNFTDKRVGVIGTGSSAVQITSALAGRTAHYSLFQRTPQWIAPCFQMARPQWLRNLERRFPFIVRCSSKMQRKLFESSFSNAVSGHKIPNKIIELLCKRNLNKVKDQDLKAKLIPHYNMGCKRLVASDTFYAAIQRPGTTLVTSAIKCIAPKGIYTEDGTFHEMDVLVMATGFYAMDYLRGMVIENKQGETLNDKWAERAFAHRSVSIAGFPNLFMVAGPHSPYGTTPATQLAEIQVNYLLELINKIIIGDTTTICAREEAQKRYNDQLDSALPDTVWASGCTNWYLDEQNLPGVYPFPLKKFREEMKSVKFEEYHLNK